MLKYLIEKEFKQFLRHPFMPKMAVLYPIILILVLPLVVTMEVKDVKVCIVDSDNTTSSQRLANKISSSTFFVMSGNAYSADRAHSMIEYGEADIVLTIADGFERKLLFGEGTDVMISANATDATKAGIGSHYLNAIINDFANKTLTENGGAYSSSEAAYASRTPKVSQLNLFNPSMNYRVFMLPALIGIITITICCVFPAVAIVSEKEKGTLEQINVTPIRRWQFVLAKLIPYWIIGLVALSISFLLAWLVYGFVPEGSFVTIYAASLLMTLTMSGIGLIISNHSNTFQQAILIFFFVMITTMLMSGLFTPTSSMPYLVQLLSYLMPPRYFMEIMRGVYLKGSGFGHLWKQFAWLGGFAAVSCLVAVVTYSKRSK